MLYLFDLIGYKSIFLKTGEFYSLMIDFKQLFPFFDAIVKAKSEEDMLQKIGETTDEVKGAALHMWDEVIKSRETKNEQEKE
jgi:hypothetical protein